MSKINIVVIGPGLIGKKHIDLVNNNNQTQLRSIVAPNQFDNQSIAKANKVPLYETVEECIKNEYVDGVIIASPNQFHFKQAVTCIKAGIPILIEKPITADIKEAKSLTKLCSKYNTKVLVGHHRTYSNLLSTARDVINSGRLGRLVSVIGSAQFYKPDQYYIDGPWRMQPGWGGPILINMIHEVSNLETLLGRIKGVHALSSSTARAFLVEDTVAINLLFESGVLGTFLLSDAAAAAKSWEQTSRENPSYPTYTNEECYFLAGTRGSLSIPSMNIKYFPDDLEASWWNQLKEEKIDVTINDPLECQFEHFVDVIKNNAKPAVSVYDGSRYLMVIDAIKKSISQKKYIQIKDI